jgi:ZIP family zinc transporter
MVSAGAIAFVFGAGLVTALATGLGAIPFFLFGDISDRWNVALWGIASGIMLAASGFGLLNEGLAASSGFPSLLLAGTLAGVVLVIIADALLDRVDLHDHSHDHHDTPEEEASMHRSDGGYAAGATESETIPSEDAPAVSAAIAEGDLRKLVLILGVLTVHSFPEGVAIGVSFAELGLEGGVELFGLVVPVLAIFMTIAISIHNIPEGIAISIPLRSMDVGEWRMVAAAVFSSLPQPIGAVIAFVFVRWAQAFLPFGFGFAAGAMIYLVLAEFVPEALEIGADLNGGGRRELAAGILGGVVLMLPLMLV